MKKITPFRPDLVIGIGGGSVLDIAKLVAAQLDNEQQLKEYVGIGLLKGRKKKLICVPCNLRVQGSEVSPNAILVDDADNQKKGIISPFLVPDIVYVDPLLTISVPPAITAATGLDALTHCLEAYTNKFAQPFVDMYAYEGMRLIAANIVTAVIDGSNMEAREKVAMGSLLGWLLSRPGKYSRRTCFILSIGKHVSFSTWFIQCVIVALCDGIQYSCSDQEIC
jgi:alcohol dehydrogenase class IV